MLTNLYFGYGVGWYDYGRRMYDPQLGIFHVQDRFAEKYFDFSPYQYAANNPIKYIDVNGDSIMIRHRGENIMYRDGQLYWAGTNKQYDGKALIKDGKHAGELKGFVGKTLKALNDVKNGGDAGNELVSNLENNNNYAIIERGGNSANGNRISWSPGSSQSGFDVNGDSKRPSFIGLAHEMAHVWDLFQDGKIDYSTWYTTQGKSVPNAEQYATFIENQIRYENNIPLRAFYGKEINYDTNNTTGTGRILLDVNGPYGPTNIYGNYNFYREKFFKGL